MTHWKRNETGGYELIWLGCGVELKRANALGAWALYVDGEAVALLGRKATFDTAEKALAEWRGATA